MTARFAPVYFTDENTMGLGKLLRRNGRTDIRYPGHEELLGVPLGSADLEWMPVVGALGLIVITRDRRIRTRPAELAAYWEHGIRSVWIGAKQDLAPMISCCCSSVTRADSDLRSSPGGQGPGRLH